MHHNAHEPQEGAVGVPTRRQDFNSNGTMEQLHDAKPSCSIASEKDSLRKMVNQTQSPRREISDTVQQRHPSLVDLLQRKLVSEACIIEERNFGLESRVSTESLECDKDPLQSVVQDVEYPYLKPCRSSLEYTTDDADLVHIPTEGQSHYTPQDRRWNVYQAASDANSKGFSYMGPLQRHTASTTDKVSAAGLHRWGAVQNDGAVVRPQSNFSVAPKQGFFKKPPPAYVGIQVTTDQPFRVLAVNDLLDQNFILQGKRGYANEEVLPGDILLEVDNVRVEYFTMEGLHDILGGLPHSSVKLGFARAKSGRKFFITVRRHNFHEYDDESTQSFTKGLEVTAPTDQSYAGFGDPEVQAPIEMPLQDRNEDQNPEFEDQKDLNREQVRSNAGKTKVIDVLRLHKSSPARSPQTSAPIKSRTALSFPRSLTFLKVSEPRMRSAHARPLTHAEDAKALIQHDSFVSDQQLDPSLPHVPPGYSTVPKNYPSDGDTIMSSFHFSGLGTSPRLFHGVDLNAALERPQISVDVMVRHDLPDQGKSSSNLLREDRVAVDPIHVENIIHSESWHGKSLWLV